MTTNPSIPADPPPDIVEVLTMLPVTGSNELVLVILASLLIVAGFLLIVLGRPD